MTLQEKVERIWALKKTQDELTEEKKSVEEKLKNATQECEVLLHEVLDEMKASGADESAFLTDDGPLYATMFKRTNVGYTDEGSVIEYLQKNGYDKFVKVTVAINKRDLNAELKKNAELKEALDGFTENKVSEYVVVTSDETHGRMVEHIVESTKAKKA